MEDPIYYCCLLHRIHRVSGPRPSEGEAPATARCRYEPSMFPRISTRSLFLLTAVSCSYFLFRNVRLLQELHRTASGAVNSAATFHYVPFENALPPDSIKRFKPLQILEQYKAWHSLESLQRDPHNRRFAVAYYSCPLQAGNRLHHFMNSFLWAILTNRTLLWDYWDRSNCFRYGVYAKGICQSANTEPECSPFLQRFGWIPSHDEWAERLSFYQHRQHFWQNEPGPYQLHLFATHINTTTNKEAKDIGFFRPGDERYRGIDSPSHPTYNEPVVAFPQMLYRQSFLMYDKYRHELLHTEQARTLAEDLYSEGADFLFGMLFHASFQFSPDFYQRTTEFSASVFQNSTYTVALHSRHQSKEQDGCDIAGEEVCLERLLGDKIDCHVFVMSDRQCTIDQTIQYIQNELSCHVEQTTHKAQAKQAWQSEHGAFAGGGFYEDWILASRARSAVISGESTSSQLIQERIDYMRKLEGYDDGIVQCRLQKP